MKTLLSLAFLLTSLLPLQAAAPLRVFIRGGVKTHGPNAHEHERFLNDWLKILAERGMKTDGAKDWPSAEQFKNTDVLVMYAQDGGNATPEQKANLADFTKRGGGIVVIHTAAVSNDPAWWKSVIGGAWVPGKTKWREGPMELNYKPASRDPIIKDAKDFKMDDEIYYDLDMAPDIHVLATTHTQQDTTKPAGKDAGPDVQAQMWTYEKGNYRAFVSIPGHLYSTFERPNYRVILLRGIAWAGKRQNLDEFCKPGEIKSLLE